MESELKNAWILAGVKSALGLLLVGSLVAIRVVTASHGQEDTTAASAADLVADSSSPSASAGTVVSQVNSSERSMAARTTSSLDEEVTGRGNRRDHGDRMVSCQMHGRVQFMTANDCAVRGGNASRLGKER